MYASLTGHLLKLDSSGVKHEDQREKKRSGRGIFRWPNGSRYEGDFVDNKRHGEGKQEWPDGSSYEGNFKDDIREGYGRHTWYNGETYEGAYLGDRRHGKGMYYWPNGTKYEGIFSNDLKDGFGIFVFNDSRRFEGFYKNNERNGPGILTYCDGQQDVGIWQGEKLIKLCSIMENAFMFQHFPDYYVNAGENVPVKVKRANSALAVARNVMGGDEKHTLSCEQNPVKGSEISVPALQVPTTFPYADILHGVRNLTLGRRGPCEEASEELLRASGEGDRFRVTELLEQGRVHVDVADKTGFTSLLAASVNCHKDVINCLLDYGADANKLNNEGLSALAACHVLFYTKHTWKDNIAETLGDENLFNSVQWDIPNGTFVQRRNNIINASSRTKLQVPESESGCSLKTLSQTPLVSTFSHLEMNDSLTSSNIRVSNSCSVNNNICDENEYTPHITGLTVSEKNDNGKHSENTRYNKMPGKEECSDNHKNESNGRYFENSWDPKGDVEDEKKTNLLEEGCRRNSKNKEGRRNVDGLSNVLGITDLTSDKEHLIARHLSVVDKNVFIHEFLNRTASAMSTVSHSTMQSNLDDLYLNFRKPLIVTDSRNETFDYLLEQNNVRNCEDKKDYGSVISCEHAPESQHYSVLNAIGSLLQSSSNMDDVACLNSVEQNRQKLLTQQRRPHLEATVRLLLKRGANPNVSSLPLPVLFFAVKAADTAAVEILLKKGARTDARLVDEKMGVTPLHIAVALPEDAVTITSLLLKAGADPDMRDFAFGRKEGGRTPLHTACCREDNDEEANCVISLLLQHKANPDMLCKGHSALSLAIASGNDLAVDTLLKHHADPSLSLTHGVGSALCSAVSFSAERRRKIVDRMRLLNKLIRNGANILAPIVVSNEHPPGTVVDYAYCVFYQDRRIAHTPYHALTSSEREVYVARRRMLDHLGELLRTYVLKKEKKLLEEQLKLLKEEAPGQLTQENCDRTVSFYGDASEKGLRDSGIDSSLGKESTVEKSILSSDTRLPDCGLRVAVVQTPSDHMSVSRLSQRSSKKLQLVKKNRFRYCYECGRSVSVRLSACTRCREVFYCSRSCKLKAWNSRHKEECIRLSGTKKSSLSRRTDSPTPVTNSDKNNIPINNDGNVKELNVRSCSTSLNKSKSLSRHTNKSVISH